MKPSHIQTPRTLADCTFEVGYAAKNPIYRDTTLLESVIYGVIGVALFALFGLLWVRGVYA